MDNNKPGKIYLVIPCYNEEQILHDSASQLLEKLRELIRLGLAAPQSTILMVDDGSSDRTWEIISELHAAHSEISGLRLSANRGHQAALLSGLLYARSHADAVISMDADLQDDINVLDRFLEEYCNGNDIVYGVRSDRSSDTFFKRFSAETFYRLIRLLGVHSIYNHADYRLMSRRAINALAEYKEVNLYLRGLVPLLGFRQSVVFYQRKKTTRPTHYPLAKMCLLAWDGITSFSARPIRLISLLGFLTLLLGGILLLRFLYVKFFGYTVDGWTSLVLVILLFGGVQLLSIGVIGEYIAKTYMEVKARPRFCIQEVLEEQRSDTEKCPPGKQGFNGDLNQNEYKRKDSL